MTDLKDISTRLKQTLALNLEPVGVRIYGQGETPPASVAEMDQGPGVKSYCQALSKAAAGETFFGGAPRLGCVLGVSILGLTQNPDPLLDDSVLEKYGVGLFETEEASQASVLGARREKAGHNSAVLIGPLGTIPDRPQVVIFEVDPVQAMWLLYAANYSKGGAQMLPQSGGVAGGCADVTLLPLDSGEPNITFLGLGCRLKSNVPPGSLLLGVPAANVEDLTLALEKMAKPIAMLSDLGRTG